MNFKMVKQELMLIKKKNRGFLTPEAVVAYAKNKNSALHKYFTWNDTEAAERWRLEEASRLIRRIYVTVLPGKKQYKIRAYVSLSADRGRGGYRDTIEVMSDEDLRIQMIEDVKEELQAFRKKLRVVSVVADRYAQQIEDTLEAETVKMGRRVASA